MDFFFFFGLTEEFEHNIFYPERKTGRSAEKQTKKQEEQNAFKIKPPQHTPTHMQELHQRLFTNVRNV